MKAAALKQNPDLEDLSVYVPLAVYADEKFVDLRFKLTADGFCHWYGSQGEVVGGKLEWTAGPANPCDR